MNLDAGICSVFRVREGTTGAGGMPVKNYELVAQGWYGELAFETAPAQAVPDDLTVQTAGRIRMWQNRYIDGRCVLVFADTFEADGFLKYPVTRAYHGRDEEAGADITDITYTAGRM